jgi:hypothetical protein
MFMRNVLPHSEYSTVKMEAATFLGNMASPPTKLHSVASQRTIILTKKIFTKLQRTSRNHITKSFPMFPAYIVRVMTSRMVL